MRSEAVQKGAETLRPALRPKPGKGDVLRFLEAMEASNALLQEEALAEKEMERVLHDASLADEKMAENARTRILEGVNLSEKVERNDYSNEKAKALSEGRCKLFCFHFRGAVSSCWIPPTKRQNKPRKMNRLI